MKITHSTAIALIPQADNVGHLKTLLAKNGGLESGDVNALIEIGSGTGIVAAMENSGIYDNKGTAQSNQGNFRSRLATAMLNVVRSAMAPISEKIAEEIAQAKLAETDQEKAAKHEAKLAAWIAGGRKGRRPHGGNDKSMEAIKTAFHEAVTETRSKLDLGVKGRIPTSLTREYHETLTKTFTSKLKGLSKTEKLHDTIENIVSEFIGELDEETLVANEIENAILDARKNADKVARETIGASERGRISGENISEYNKAAKAAFRESLREIKETHGSLPDTMDNLMETLSLYVADEQVEAKNKDKGKDKNKKAPKQDKKGGKKAQAEVEPVSGEVSEDKSETETETDEEAEANAAVAAGVTE